MKKIISLILSLTLFYCSSGQKKGDGFIYVYNIKGINLDDAELNAKRKILEDGIGDLVEGRSDVSQGQLIDSLVQSTVEGYVVEYTQIGKERPKDGVIEIDAKGKVNAKKNRRRDSF